MDIRSLFDCPVSFLGKLKTEEAKDDNSNGKLEDLESPITYSLAYAIPIDIEKDADKIDYDEAGRFFESIGYIDKPIVM
jgi:hypothetical protein